MFSAWLWEICMSQRWAHCRFLKSNIQAWGLANGEPCPRGLTRQTHKCYLGLNTETEMDSLLQASTLPKEPKVGWGWCPAWVTCLKYSPLKSKSAPHHLTKAVEKAGHRIFNFIISYGAMRYKPIKNIKVTWNRCVHLHYPEARVVSSDPKAIPLGNNGLS